MNNSKYMAFCGTIDGRRVVVRHFPDQTVSVHQATDWRLYSAQPEKTYTGKEALEKWDELQVLAKRKRWH